MQIVLLGILIIGIALVTYRFVYSYRDIVFTPHEVHLLVNTKTTVTIALYRKKPWSLLTSRPASYRPVTLGGQSTIYRCDTGTQPATVMAHRGVAMVTLVGIAPGKDALFAEAPSSWAGARYGPKSIPVSVYASQAAVPHKVTLSPLLPVCQN